MLFGSFFRGVILLFFGSFWLWFVILGCFSVLFYCCAQHVYATFLRWLLTAFLAVLVFCIRFIFLGDYVLFIEINDEIGRVILCVIIMFLFCF